MQQSNILTLLNHLEVQYGTVRMLNIFLVGLTFAVCTFLFLNNHPTNKSNLSLT